MNRPRFVIVDKVIREIKFPKIPSASTDIMETPATQNRKEVTEIKEKVTFELRWTWLDGNKFIIEYVKP